MKNALLALVVVALSTVGCSELTGDDTTSGEGDSGSDYEISGAGCNVSGASIQVTDANGSTQDKQYTGCRVRWSASSHVVTWQLTTPGTSGSWFYPGDGWINLSFDGDAPEQSSFAIARTVSELPAQVPMNQVVFTMASKGTRAGAQGSLSVGSNLINSRGGGGFLDVSFDNVRVGTMSGPLTLRGSISLSATSAAASASDSDSESGNSSSNTSTASCQAYTTQCTSSNVPTQAPCYCAAACLCAAQGASCESENRRSAAALGTTCSY